MSRLALLHSLANCSSEWQWGNAEHSVTELYTVQQVCCNCFTSFYLGDIGICHYNKEAGGHSKQSLLQGGGVEGRGPYVLYKA